MGDYAGVVSFLRIELVPGQHKHGFSPWGLGSYSVVIIENFFKNLKNKGQWFRYELYTLTHPNLKQIQAYHLG